MAEARDSGLVHVVMAGFVGTTLIVVGLYLTYRVQSARDMVRVVESHLTAQDAELTAIRADQARIITLLEATRNSNQSNQ